MKQQFPEALVGKKIPILTLDNKWYKLLDEDTKRMLSDTQEELNTLLKRQGKINTETKDIRRLKKKLMGEIVEMADQPDSAEMQKKMEQHKKLVNECNEKLDGYQDEMKELPGRIEELNRKLMLKTMECCYDTMRENETEIEKTNEWVKEIRKELKIRLVKKQALEQQNQRIYAYMHDVFGADVVDIFDMQNRPSE